MDGAIKNPTKREECVNVAVPEAIKEYMVNYIDNNMSSCNPYLCDDSVVHDFAKHFSEFVGHLKHENINDDSSMQDFLHVINMANSGQDIPVVLFSNVPTEPEDSLLEVTQSRGFDYAFNEQDRMKKYYYSEWVSWMIACLMNHDATTHPSEHGGKNRFHLISPLPSEDQRLRDAGASVGGGKFFQHNDATIFTELKTADEVSDRLRHYNTNLDAVCAAVKKTSQQVISEITSQQYTRVDVTILKGVLNTNTMTNIGTPGMLQEDLMSNGFSNNDLARLSRMPIAHIAGPADGIISGYIGEITHPVIMENGNIVGTCVNSAENRMEYVGTSYEDSILFSEFVDSVRNMDTLPFLLSGSDLLFIPNAFYCGQTNYTHGRDKLGDNEYKIPIGNGKFSRRMHCRLYAKSRRRDGKPHLVDCDN